MLTCSATGGVIYKVTAHGVRAGVLGPLPAFDTGWTDGQACREAGIGRVPSRPSTRLLAVLARVLPLSGACSLGVHEGTGRRWEWSGRAGWFISVLWPRLDLLLHGVSAGPVCDRPCVRQTGEGVICQTTM